MSKGEIIAILDTSALYPLLKRLGKKALSVLLRATILDLTKYELGDALWREHKRGLIEEWEKLIKSWSEIIAELPQQSIEHESLKEVEGIAVERDLTFYDSSYVYMAEKLNIKLVTEDEDVLRKCRNAISLNEFLKEINAV